MSTIHSFMGNSPNGKHSTNDQAASAEKAEEAKRNKEVTAQEASVAPIPEPTAWQRFRTNYRTWRFTRHLGHLASSRRLRSKRARKALVLEHGRHGRRDEGATAGEQSVRATYQGVAATRLHGALDKLTPLAVDVVAHSAEDERLAGEEEATLAAPVGHPSAGVSSLLEMRPELDSMKGTIESDRSEGKRAHDRLPGILLRVPFLVLVADLVLNVYFVGGVFNVAWTAPFADPAGLVLAACVGTFIAGTAFGLYKLAGLRLNETRRDDGSLDVAGLDLVGIFLLGAAGVLALAQAVLAYTRVSSEVAAAGVSNGALAAVVLGMVVALCILGANILVVVVYGFDGSFLTRRAALLAGAMGPVEQRLFQLGRQRLEVARRLSVAKDAFSFAHAKAVSHASAALHTGDRVVDLARTETGSPAATTPVADANAHSSSAGYHDPTSGGVPVLDERPLTALGQRVAMAGVEGSRRHTTQPTIDESDSGDSKSGE